MAAQTRKMTRPPQDDYLELVHQFPLRPIRSDAENEEALAVSQRLMLKGPDGSLTTGEQAYLETLSMLISAYESKRYPIARSTPLERLRFVVEESGTSQARLASILGLKQPAVSLILSGKRSLSVDSLKRLASHFRVSADYFI